MQSSKSNKKDYLVRGELFIPAHKMSGFFSSIMGKSAKKSEVEWAIFYGNFSKELKVGACVDPFGHSVIKLIDPPQKEAVNTEKKRLCFTKKYEKKRWVITHDLFLEKVVGETEYWVGTWHHKEKSIEYGGIMQMIAVPAELDLQGLPEVADDLSKIIAREKILDRLNLK